MSNDPSPPERAPAALRFGLPSGAVVAFLGLVIAAAFTGTARWGLAIPIGLTIGGATLVLVGLALRRRGVKVLEWIDDYWNRED